MGRPFALEERGLGQWPLSSIASFATTKRQESVWGAQDGVLLFESPAKLTTVLKLTRCRPILW